MRQIDEEMKVDHSDWDIDDYYEESVTVPTAQKSSKTLR